MSMHSSASNATVSAVSLLEESCLTVLLEERARYQQHGWLSASEMAQRSGLTRWLGPTVGGAVAGRVLDNLLGAGKVETTPGMLAAPCWRIAEEEARARRLHQTGGG